MKKASRGDGIPAELFQPVQVSHSVISDSLQPHELQHSRPSCPSPTPRVYSNSCPLSQWYHSTISFFALPFSSCPQSFPASGSFKRSHFFRWPKFWSVRFSTVPSNEYSELISFRMDWLDVLAAQGTQEFSPTPKFQSINSLARSRIAITFLSRRKLLLIWWLQSPFAVILEPPK